MTGPPKELSDDMLAVTLRHLSVRRQNFYKSLSGAKTQEDTDHFNDEITKLNEVIGFFESVRETRRLAANGE